VVPDSQRYALDILAREGLTFPDAHENFTFGAMVLQHQFSSSIAAHMDFSYGYRNFGSEIESGIDEFLVDGADLRMQGFLRRSLRGSSGVSISYSYRRNDSQHPQTTSQDAGAAWDIEVSRPGFTMNVRAFGGVNRFQTRGLYSGSKYNGIVEAELSTTLRGNTNLFGRYFRRPTESLGFGRNLSIDQVAARFDHTFAGRVLVNGWAEWVQSKDLIDIDFTYNVKRFSTTALYKVTPKFGIGGGYSHNRYEQSTPLPQLIEDVWHFFVTYSLGWGLQPATLP
jgi:hypothetical protein